MSNFFYSLLRHMPFKEAWIPVKMALGRLRNRRVIIPPFTPGREGGGSLEVRDGVPILRLSGSARDIGFQHGRLLAPQVQTVQRHYLGIFAGKFDYDLKLARVMEKHIPPHFIEEMRGLAEGAGMSYEDILVTTCFLDIHKVTACSTFVVHDASSSTGEILMGRNLDFPALSVAHQANIVAVVRRDGAKPFASVTWPGFLGCISGMNTDGLTLAMMLVYGHTRSDHLDGVPFALHYRSVLEECGDVREATARLQRREYGVCNNLMLADRKRDAAVLELHSQSVGEIRDASDFPVLYCTNHFRTGPRRWAFALTAFSSYPRLRRLARATKRAKKERNSFGPDDVKHQLQRVAIPGINLQRMVFYPERLALDVAFGKPAAGERVYHALTREVLWRIEEPPTAESQIRLAAALYVLGFLSSKELTRVGDEAIGHGICTPALAELATIRNPIMSDVGLLFEAVLDELNVRMPSKDEALWAVLGYHIRRIAEGYVVPSAGLWEVVNTYESAGHYSSSVAHDGTSHRVERLIGLFYDYDEFDDCPEDDSVEGKLAKAARDALDTEVVKAAREWLRLHGDEKHDG